MASNVKVSDIAGIVNNIKKAQMNKSVMTVEWRKTQLKAMKKCLTDNWESVRILI